MPTPETTLEYIARIQNDLSRQDNLISDLKTQIERQNEIMAALVENIRLLLYLVPDCEQEGIMNLLMQHCCSFDALVRKQMPECQVNMEQLRRDIIAARQR